MTEDWVSSEIFCPSCGSTLEGYENNRPVADFHCPACIEEFELKSKRYAFGKKVVDGAYNSMIQRLTAESSPNLFLLNYLPGELEVNNFLVIPKHYLMPSLIEKRKPLAETARRSGWVGCNILLASIPKSGQIFYVKDGRPESKKDVLQTWQKTLFLQEGRPELRGWTLDIMGCVDTLGKGDFTLREVYTFEASLKNKHPDNENIRAKIRQQLQFLRDKGYLKFVGAGEYKLS